MDVSRVARHALRRLEDASQCACLSHTFWGTPMMFFDIVCLFTLVLMHTQVLKLQTSATAIKLRSPATRLVFQSRLGHKPTCVLVVSHRK